MVSYPKIHIQQIVSTKKLARLSKFVDIHRRKLPDYFHIIITLVDLCPFLKISKLFSTFFSTGDT